MTFFLHHLLAEFICIKQRSLPSFKCKNGAYQSLESQLNGLKKIPSISLDKNTNN